MRIRTDNIGAIEALFVDDQEFDLCILAHQMPEKDDGLKILSEIRAEGRNVPVIIFSDHVDQETATKINDLDGIVIGRKRGEEKLSQTVEQILTT